MTGGATAGHIVSTTANVLYILDVVRAIAHFWLWCTLDTVHCTYYALSERSDDFGTHFDSGKTQNTDDEYCMIYCCKMRTKQSTSVKCF